MLYVQQPAVLRMMRAGVAAVATVLVMSGGALAQTAAAPCFEFVPNRPRIEPPTPMLVDKCTGRTWLLTRTSRGAYRWAAIPADGEQPASDKPKATDRPATDTGQVGRADKEGGGSKCFTFNNRKFCE